jgi:hypothetical protein
MLLLNNLGYFRSNARWSALCLRYRAFSNKTIARLQSTPCVGCAPPLYHDPAHSCRCVAVV